MAVTKTFAWGSHYGKGHALREGDDAAKRKRFAATAIERSGRRIARALDVVNRQHAVAMGQHHLAEHSSRALDAPGTPGNDLVRPSRQPLLAIGTYARLSVLGHQGAIWYDNADLRRA